MILDLVEKNKELNNKLKNELDDGLISITTFNGELKELKNNIIELEAVIDKQKLLIIDKETTIEEFINKLKNNLNNNSDQNMGNLNHLIEENKKLKSD